MPKTKAKLTPPFNIQYMSKTTKTSAVTWAKFLKDPANLDKINLVLLLATHQVKALCGKMLADYKARNIYIRYRKIAANKLGTKYNKPKNNNQ